MTTTTTTPPTASDVIEWLKETIERANEDVKENSTDPNSYGTGYDRGYRDAFRVTLEYLEGNADV